MTRHTGLVKAALAIIAIGAMSVPAMAREYNQRPQANEYHTESGKECSVGETYNGGSISSIGRTGRDREQSNRDPNDCNNVNRLPNR